jgi:DNA-binding NtrC family response regulator
MDEHLPTTLNPLSFLQAFIVQSVRIAEMGRIGGDSGDHIVAVGLATSNCLEEVARRHLGLEGPLEQDSYAALIADVKNSIGGQFECVPGEAGSVRLINHRCPFGDLVREAPELCRMTSSVFGAIAARNFRYAKVELHRRIAAGDGLCDVRVHLDPAMAATRAGDEYRWHDGVVSPLSGATAVSDRVEASLCRAWAGPLDASRKQPLRRRIVAESKAMQDALHAVEVVAPTSASVLVTGETGVGKEVIARAVHAFSLRADRMFLAINCGAIPEDLIDSTLFGHEKGAFTDAHKSSEGLFERANGGTLFLDEVDCLTPSAQSRLLRVLQEGEYERVGGNAPRYTDVRIIAASNRCVDALVADGRFRQDLYYRLNVVPIHIPPLRQRPDDISALVVHFMKRLADKYGGRPKILGERAWAVALSYSWPGNLREMENVLERAHLFAPTGVIESLPIETQSVDDVPLDSLQKVKKRVAMEVEARVISDALAHARGNVSAVARSMGITPRAVHMKLRMHGIDAARYRIGPGSRGTTQT